MKDQDFEDVISVDRLLSKVIIENAAFFKASRLAPILYLSVSELLTIGRQLKVRFRAEHPPTEKQIREFLSAFNYTPTDHLVADRFDISEFEAQRLLIKFKIPYRVHRVTYCRPLHPYTRNV